MWAGSVWMWGLMRNSQALIILMFEPSCEPFAYPLLPIAICCDPVARLPRAPSSIPIPSKLLICKSKTEPDSPLTKATAYICSDGLWLLCDPQAPLLSCWPLPSPQRMQWPVLAWVHLQNRPPHTRGHRDASASVKLRWQISLWLYILSLVILLWWWLRF